MFMFDKKDTLKFLSSGVASETDLVAVKEKIDAVAKEGRVLNIKFGLDPSAPDIHLGHTVALRKLRQMQNLGHKVIIIIGDFTGMIGDPTGKSKTRNQLSKKQVEENAKTYLDQIFKVIDRSKTEVRMNSEWYDKMDFRDVINLSAKATVARILERDDFAKRFKNGTPISLHEFFYPLMQAYDSVVVAADLEFGGTDQTFNILMGRNIQRDYGMAPQVPVFIPLLEGIDGVEKMSKSLGNYIGINEPAEVIYEKVMKIPDNLIIKYYTLTTDVHPDDIAKIQKRLESGENPRDIKMELAKEITTLYHSVAAAERAEEIFKTAYQKQQAPENTPKIPYKLDANTDALNALITSLMSTGKYASRGFIRRLIQQGAVSVDGTKIDLSNVPEMGSGTIVKVGKAGFFEIASQELKKKVELDKPQNGFNGLPDKTR
jgi:tyrosyl-tRNA synthetase